MKNYHYFHLRDTAGQERDFHLHDFDKLVAAHFRQRGLRPLRTRCTACVRGCCW